LLVHEFLERTTALTPEKIALVCGQRRFTYQQINRYANQLAAFLQDQGLQRGDRVAVYLPNCEEAVISIFGILKAGGVFVVLNHTTKVDKLITILNDCGAAAIVTTWQDVDFLQDLRQSVPSLRVVLHKDSPQQLKNLPSVDGVYGYFAALERQCDLNPPHYNIDLDLASLVYTSGSTGESKGVMEDHSNVDFATDSIISYLDNRADDIVLNCLPLSFDYGLYQLLMVFKFGGTLVLEKGFAFPAVILKQIQDEHVTGFPGVPTIFSILMNTDLSSYDLSSLRYITNTAAALPVSHIRQLRATFPHVQMFSMYGLTETKRTLYMPPEILDQHPGSVGIAIPGTEVWLEDETGNTLGAGEIGELVVRGRHVMRGYWNAPEMTAQRFRPGRLPHEWVCYTGDLFRRDEEGYYTFIARKDDIIKTRGEKVSPVELERVLYGMAGVLRVAVIGVPDAVLGEAIKVYVVSGDPALTENDVLLYCRTHVEDYMVPKMIVFTDDLPLTESGKILKSALR
jgi:acyl-CoA synthetase (AMP-forming)/AMP-acid ligase II